ncbi:cellulase family glycosylhydrolase [Lentzea sp. NPDC058450]|uniref:cellulase family glycosylhydrolase n=1 Tax=Lentzea sp. NPDC058450 TaxID=3346505 RepID=UPI003660FAF8
MARPLLLALPAALAVSVVPAVLVPTVANAAVTEYQAENATITNGVVESNHAGFTGAGFVNYDNATGSAVEFTVNSPTSAAAKITFRYSNGTSTNRPMNIYLNDTLKQSGWSFPGTGAWSTWNTKTITLGLKAGSNTIRTVSSSANGGPNLDRIDVDTPGGGTPDTQAPSVPGNLRSTGSTSSSVSLAWDAATDNVGVTGYVLSNGQSVSGTSHTVTGLSPDTEYTFSVQARDAAGNTSGASESVTVRTQPGGGGGDTEAPSVPGNLRSTGTTSSSISLAWNASTDNVGVTGYTLSNGQSVSSTTVTVTGLTANTDYTFTVRARDAAGNQSGASNSVTVRTQPGGGGTRPHDINGLLRVCGVQLCNQYGKPIQLRGASTHGIQWYHQCSKPQWWDALTTDWNADFIRVAMYIQEDGYETDPRKFTDLMHGYIEEATRRGIYVLVDWHQLSPGDPNYNLARAKTFFTEIAQRHKDKTNIIYDIANEPNGTSWAKVKSYAEQMIPVIRNIDPDSLIVSGTNGWSTFGHSDGTSPSEVLNNRVNATNFMYSFHFYAQAHRDAYLSVLDQVSSQVPVFVTEFGTQAASGGGSNDFTMSQKYIDLMERKKISWANWNFSDDGLTGAVFKTGTCAGTTFAGTNVLKPAGVWVRERMRTPDNFPTS